MPQAKSHDNISTDLAAWAGQEIHRFNLRADELENRPDAIGIEKTYRDHEVRDLRDRVIILRSFLSIVCASTALGCLAQIGELDALVEFNLMSTNTEDQDVEDLDRIRRLIFSVKAYLRIDLPSDQSGTLGSEGMHIDPWIPYEMRVASVLEQDGKRSAA